MRRVTTVMLATTLATASLWSVVAVGLGAAPARAATGGLTCTYTITSQWANGFMADLTIANAGPPVAGWTARWTFAEPTSAVQGWSALITLRGNQITATNASWNGFIGTGRMVSFGWSATAASTSVPTDLSVNGTAC
jgi:cellulase/cellobiase CelA1